MHSPSPQFLIQRNGLPPPFNLAKKRIHMESHLKEELTDLFRKLLGIPNAHRYSFNGCITTLS